MGWHPHSAGANFPRVTLLLGGGRHKSIVGDAHICLILHMKTTFKKLKINKLREYIFIFP
jgi:hypothetical protein